MSVLTSRTEAAAVPAQMREKLKVLNPLCFLMRQDRLNRKTLAVCDDLQQTRHRMEVDIVDHICQDNRTGTLAHLRRFVNFRSSFEVSRSLGFVVGG